MKIEKWLNENTSSLWGKNVAITGSTGGIGVELCEYLCKLGANLILVDRNLQKSERLKNKLLEKYGTEIRCITADLEDFESVKAVAEQLKNEAVDIFLHNAGAYSIPRKVCSTGYDNVFQINFVSPYYMIKELLPNLRKVKGRVVVVGSIAHNYSKTNKDDIDFKNHKRASRVYGNAKRFLMFSLFELFKNETEVTLSVTHPGITFTNITAHYPKLIFAVIKHPMKIIFMKPRVACLSVLLGIFKNCEYLEWIGPGFFNVWGKPKKQRLKTVSKTEREFIAKTAEEIYKKL